MADAPLRGANGRQEWFWEPGDEKAVYSLDTLVDMYYKSVGRNSTLILGITSDDNGLIPIGDFNRMAEFDAKIKELFSKPVATAQSHSHMTTIKLKRETPINQIVI